MAKWRRWGPILFGVGILIVFLAIGVLIFGISWMREHIVIENAAAATADESLDQIRDRFAERPPLIEVRDGRVRRNDPPPDAKPAALSTLHVLAWEADEEKLARIDLPFWLVRFRGLPIDFDGGEFDIGGERVTLNAADIERYGRGIVVDLEMSSGERAVIWVE